MGCAAVENRIAGHEFTAMTPASITDPAVLRQELAGITERGIAVEHRESNPDVSCVAAPVRDSAGRAVAALSISSISVPMIRWSDARAEELALSARVCRESLAMPGASAAASASCEACAVGTARMGTWPDAPLAPAAPPDPAGPPSQPTRRAPAG